jgi:hypothetical protein
MSQPRDARRARSWMSFALSATVTLVLLGASGCREEVAERETLAEAPVAAHEVSAPAPTAPAPTAPAGDGAAAHAPAAPKRPAPSVPEPDPDASARLSLNRLVVSTGVEGREPVGAGTTFDADESDRIYAFVDVSNPTRGASEIVVTFEPPDGSGARGNVTLDVGASPRWRTWAYTRGARVPGTWRAVVRTADGRELGEEKFEITL